MYPLFSRGLAKNGQLRMLGKFKRRSAILDCVFDASELQQLAERAHKKSGYTSYIFVSILLCGLYWTVYMYTS